MSYITLFTVDFCPSPSCISTNQMWRSQHDASDDRINLRQSGISQKNEMQNSFKKVCEDCRFFCINLFHIGIELRKKNSPKLLFVLVISFFCMIFYKRYVTYRFCSFFVRNWVFQIKSRKTFVIWFQKNGGLFLLLDIWCQIG